MRPSLENAIHQLQVAGQRLTSLSREEYSTLLDEVAELVSRAAVARATGMMEEEIQTYRGRTGAAR